MLEFSAERAPEWLRRLCIDAQVAGRNVLRQRRRSALGVVAVTFGVVSMLLAGGFIEWILWATREATIKGGLGHIQVVRPGLLDGGLADPYSFLLPERGRERDLVEKAPGVQAVAATLSFSGLASHGEATLSFLGDGVDISAQRYFSEVNILPGGQNLSAEDPKGIVMGRGLAENLGAKVGDVVVLLATTGSGGINAVEARIRGLFFTVSKAYDDAALRAPLALAQQLVRTAQVHRWIVILDDTARTTAAAAALRAQLPAAGLEVVPWHRLADFYNKTYTLLSRQVNVVVVIIAAIIVLGISNTLTMAVMERTGEVGTSLALGVTRGRILVRFLAEGILLGVIGGTAGVLLGVACAWGISAVGIPMPPAPGMSEGYLGRIMVTGELVWEALLLAVVTTLVASVYPAWRASRLVIVDALRHNRWHAAAAFVPRTPPAEPGYEAFSLHNRWRERALTNKLLKLAARNLFRHRMRTAMSLAAVGVGVGAVILSGGFVHDIYIQLREAIIHSQLGHVQLARAGFFSMGSRSPEKHVIAEPDLEKARIASLPEVASVMARLYFSGLLNNGRTDLPIIGEGIEPSAEAALGTYLKISAGRQLGDADAYGILIGHGLAQALKLGPGDRTALVLSTAEGALNTLDFEVVGVFQSFSQDYDARAVKITLGAAQELLATAGANVLVLSLRRSEDTERIAGLLRERSIWRDLEVRTWEELNDFYKSTVQLYDRQFGVLQLIILFMVLLGVVNVINMSVFERLAEFGTMRALGNRGREVLALVLTEGLLLGLIGSAIGVALGIGLAIGISAVGIPMPPPPNSSLPYTAYIRVVPAVVGSAFLIGVVAVFLASLLPGLRVARVPIAEALRQGV